MHIQDSTVTPLPERNLDFLRMVAVLCVVANHLLTVWSVGSSRPTQVWAIGQLGVLVFFVHTSLVLMSSIERFGTERPGWVRAFYVRRAFRIYPLAVVAVLLAIAVRIPAHVPVAGVVASFADVDTRTLLSNLSLTQNLADRPSVLGVLWSLPLEVQMYLVLPFCYLVVRRRQSGPVAGLILLFIGLWLVVSSGHIPHMRRLWGLAYAPCFAGGLLAYHLARRRIRARLPPFTWPIVIAAVGALFFLLRPTPDSAERGWLPCLLLGAAIPLVRDAAPSAITSLAHKVCDVSYGLYLLHVPALWFSFVVLRSAPLWSQWLSCAALFVALPWAAHRFIEQPAIRLGKAVVAGITPTTATDAQVTITGA
jgi:peptidoglycan/LPS O-acetylase OafA/YrhL